MKTLVTSGCSFSECVSINLKTWARHLSDYFPNYRHFSKAMGSQGNGLISRSIIYQVSELLKTTPSDDILVGVMWSGPTRYDFFQRNANISKNNDGYLENPTGFIPGIKDWVILNQHWVNNYAKHYYGALYDFMGCYIYTYEHILRTQWFLEKHNVKYFMTTYTGEIFDWLEHIPPEGEESVKHLYDQIDFEYFLPAVIGEYEWCRDHSGLPFPRHNDNHPGSNQHLEFTKQVILPFLKEKFNIS
jgi:hypothetical protein